MKHHFSPFRRNTKFVRLRTPSRMVSTRVHLHKRAKDRREVRPGSRTGSCALGSRRSINDTRQLHGVKSGLIEGLSEFSEGPDAALDHRAASTPMDVRYYRINRTAYTVKELSAVTLGRPEYFCRH